MKSLFIQCLIAGLSTLTQLAYQEDDIIIQLVNKLGTKKWAEVAQRMTEKYGFQERTGKQCRERWHNHLDPSINKKPWNDQQEKIVFQKHKQFGNKWTQIAKHLPGRTDNNIKNHFYSTIRKSLRRINKILGSKNSTHQMRSIKPCILSQILNCFVQGGEISQLCLGIQNSLLQFARIKPGREDILLSEDQKKHFQNVIQKIIELNQLYEQQREQTDHKGKNKRRKSIKKRPRTKRLPQLSPQTPRFQPLSINLELKEKQNKETIEYDYSRIYQCLDQLNNEEQLKEEDMPQLKLDQLNHHQNKMFSVSPRLNLFSPMKQSSKQGIFDPDNLAQKLDNHVNQLKMRLNNANSTTCD